MPARAKSPRAAIGSYPGLVGGIGQLLETARRASARSVNAFMTATYWEIGRRIVEFEQGGTKRAGYGEELLDRLAANLAARFGRGFSRFNLGRFRLFYLSFPLEQIRATLSLESRSARLPLAAPGDLHASQLHLFAATVQLLPDGKLPAKRIPAAFTATRDPQHPLRAMLADLQTLDTVRIIECQG